MNTIDISILDDAVPCPVDGNIDRFGLSKYFVKPNGQIVSRTQMGLRVMKPKVTRSKSRWTPCGDPIIGLYLENPDGTLGYQYPLIKRLVATAFIPNPERHPVVICLDGNPANVAVENLAWASHARHNPETDYSTPRRYHFQRGGGKPPRAVQMLDKTDGRLIATYPATAVAVRHLRALGLKATRFQIRCCCEGLPKRKSCAGFRWRWAEAAEAA